jgi:hypothetical protein
MDDKEKLDELLNAYMDGQLSQRSQTEVKRLLQHDPEIAARLTELEKIRSLLAAVPVAEAPAGLIEDIKAKLERQSLVGSDSEDFDEHEGARQLLWRRAISVAAIVALAVVLAGVVFTIVGPESVDDRQVVSENWMNNEIPMPNSVQAFRERVALQTSPAELQRADANAASPETGYATAALQGPILPERFSGHLELNTALFARVDAFVKRALVDNGIMLIELPVAETEKGLYNLRCSRTTASVFIADLATIWDKFDSVTLRVKTGEPDRDVVVANITAKQINQIIAAPDVAKSIELARNTAALNAMTIDLPGTALAMDTEVNLLPIPKPVLTSGDTTPKTQDKVDETEMVDLVIQIKNTH